MPRHTTSGSPPSSRAYAASRASASTSVAPSWATPTYAISVPTMIARLLGRVHGVVVQMSSLAPSSSPGVVTEKPTVTAGSWRFW